MACRPRLVLLHDEHVIGVLARTGELAMACMRWPSSRMVTVLPARPVPTWYLLPACSAAPAKRPWPSAGLVSSARPAAGRHRAELTAARMVAGYESIYRRIVGPE